VIGEGNREGACPRYLRHIDPEKVFWDHQPDAVRELALHAMRN
jgi:hypothetical protein